jgi:hypothetical protein
MVELLAEHEARLALAQKERKLYRELYDESKRLQTQYFKDVEDSRRECQQALHERDHLTTTLRRMQCDLQVTDCDGERAAARCAHAVCRKRSTRGTG